MLSIIENKNISYCRLVIIKNNVDVILPICPKLFFESLFLISACRVAINYKTMKYTFRSPIVSKKFIE